MFRTIGLFLLLTTLVMEHVPVMDFGHAMWSGSDMLADGDDASDSPEETVKDDVKDPLCHMHWACPHPSVLMPGEAASGSHHLLREPDPIHFEVPTPPPLA